MEERITFITKEMDRQIETFHRRREEYKRKTIAVKVAIAALAALSTVLIGLQGLSDWFRVCVLNAALVFTSAVTLLTSLEAFFNHRSLYVRYTATTIQLYMRRSEFQYLLTRGTGNIAPEELDRVFSRLMSILDQTSTEWMEARQEQRSPGADSPAHEFGPR